MKNWIWITCLACTIWSCGNVELNPEIMGKWQAFSWKVQDKPVNFPASTITFEFRPDKTYEQHMGDIVNTGTFRMRSDSKLMLKDQRGQEGPYAYKMISPDTMSLRMHVGIGQFEEFILIKQ
jgi:hypothetical protein